MRPAIIHESLGYMSELTRTRVIKLSNRPFWHPPGRPRLLITIHRNKIATDDYFEELKERGAKEGAEKREEERESEKIVFACAYTSRNLIYTTRKYRAILTKVDFLNALT